MFIYNTNNRCLLLVYAYNWRVFIRLKCIKGLLEMLILDAMEPLHPIFYNQDSHGAYQHMAFD